jgi:hypothetical protein
MKTPVFQGLLDAPGWIRTSDLRIRSPLLYPAELPGRAPAGPCGRRHRDGRIRTDDPRVPNAVLYQAELHPVAR